MTDHTPLMDFVDHYVVAVLGGAAMLFGIGVVGITQWLRRRAARDR